MILVASCAPSLVSVNEPAEPHILCKDLPGPFAYWTGTPERGKRWGDEFNHAWKAKCQ